MGADCWLWQLGRSFLRTSTTPSSGTLFHNLSIVMDGFEGKRWITTALAYLKIKGKHSSNGPTALNGHRILGSKNKVV